MAFPSLSRAFLPGEMFAAFSNASFRAYVGGQSAAAFGTGLQNFALAWLCYRCAGDVSALGLLAVAMVLPQLILSMLGGHLTDNVDRRRYLMTLQVAGFALAILLAGFLVIGAPSLFMLVGYALLTSSLASLEYPARQAMQGDLVGARMFNSARGVYSCFCALGLAFGQVTAGFFLEYLHSIPVCTLFFLGSLGFVIAWWNLRSLRFDGRKEETANTKGGEEGYPSIQSIWRSPTVVFTMAQTVLLVLFGIRYAGLMPAFAAEVLREGPGAAGTLSAAVAVGYALAALLLGGVARRDRLLGVAVFSLVFMPVAVLCLAVSRNLALAVFLVLLLAILQSANINGCVASLYSAVPVRGFGRVLGLRVSLVALSDLCASFLFAQFASQAGVGAALKLSALGLAFFSIFTLVWYFKRTAPSVESVEYSKI